MTKQKKGRPQISKQQKRQRKKQMKMPTQLVKQYIDPNIKVSTTITLPNWETETISKNLNVNDLPNFEQMENEAINMWKQTEELLLKEIVKKKKKFWLKYQWRKILNIFWIEKKRWKLDEKQD